MTVSLLRDNDAAEMDSVKLYDETARCTRLLVRSRGAVHKDTFVVRLEYGERCSGVALTVKVANALDATLQKRNPGWPPVDIEISPGVVAGSYAPGCTYANDSFAERDSLVWSDIEETSKRKKEAGRQKRNNQNYSDYRGQ
jgi:hypothetical protein